MRAGAAALGALPTNTGRRRTVLRRGRRHAARAALAVRRAHQPGLGAGAAQALLPHLQFRAAGGGDRQRHRHLAERAAQLSARARVQVPEHGNGRRRADAGDAARADVRSALAMGCVARAGGAAICRRAQSAAADPAHARRRSARRGVSGSGGLPGKPRRRHPHSRSSARQRDDQGLPARSDGSRRPEAARRADRDAASSKTVAIDTPEPSPFSHEILNANPYAYLDDAPLEERRARAVQMRRTIGPDAVGRRRARSGGDRRGGGRVVPGRARCRRAARRAADADRPAAARGVGGVLPDAPRSRDARRC